MATIYSCPTGFNIAAARLTLADPCLGVQIAGTTNAFITDALESGSAEPQVREGVKIQKNSGNSKLGLSVDIRRPEVLIGRTVKVKTQKSDIYLNSLFTPGGFITKTVLTNELVIGWIEAAGALTNKVFIEIWEENEFGDCSADVALYGATRHVFGIGSPKAPTMTFTNGDNRPQELEFDCQPWRPSTGWTGPLGDFPADVVTDNNTFLAANPTKKLNYMGFYEATIPVSVCGLVAVTAAP